MASLYVVRGRDQGKHFQLTTAVIRIGRDASSHVQLFDTEASRSHCEIRVAAGDLCDLVDLGSSNGTRVNGQNINRHRLATGDRIEIGQTLLIFTGTAQPSGVEAAHRVDIVRQNMDDDGSRIVSSLSQVVPQAEQLNAAIESKSRDTDTDRSLEVMYLTAIAVGRTDDLDDLLNRILRLVFDWVDADRGCIMLRDSESNQLRPAARCDRDESKSSKEARMSISYTILDYVLKRKEGVRTSNAKDDDRFDSAASIVHGGVREALCVPLQGRYDVVGALYIDTFTSPGKLIADGSHQRFTDDHLRLITAIGHQAALAIEDTFYYSALVQSERLAAMGQTIATLSHHVKNILQGIRGGGYLIETGLDNDDTDAVRRGWRIVDRNQDRISNLVTDMLTFSKEREPQRVDANLNDQVRDVVELMQTHAAELGVQLTMEMDNDLPEAHFDPDAIHRAILNLVTNAIDAAAENVTDDASVFDSGESLLQSSMGAPAPPPAKADPPKVMVRTSFDTVDGWIIDVLDNGKGVATEDREKIFSLFESGKGARGTGLGLPVSSKILREHGGEIQILDAKGGGACFRLRLPFEGTDAEGLRQSQTEI